MSRYIKTKTRQAIAFIEIPVMSCDGLQIKYHRIYFEI